MPTNRKSTRPTKRLPEPATTAVEPGAVDQPASLVGDIIQGDFYSQVLAAPGMANLDQARRARLRDEIAMLRVVMRRVLEQAAGQELSLDAWLDTLDSLSQASARLARLVALEKSLAEKEDDDLVLLARAIREVMMERAR